MPANMLGKPPRFPMKFSHDLEGQMLAENRSRILREIKKETILPDERKEKLTGYRPKTYGKIHTQYDKLMQKAENPASFKQMDETAWTKNDKYYNERLSQERKNEVLDHLGTGDHYWDLICETGKKSREKGLQEKYGDYTLVRKEELAGDTLLFLVDENGKKESILQSEYSDRIARQIEEPLWEQETLNAPNDPLIKRIRNKLATQIDYPDKPSPMGYPDGATPQQVAGWHPEYGKRAAYYNALDPQSADAMPLTGDPETDVKVDAQKTPLKKKSKKELKAEARLIQSDWRLDILSEAMTTAGLGMINLDGEGDIDLATNDVGASASYSQSSNAQFSGSQATYNFSGSASVGQTYSRSGYFDPIDATRFDSFVTNVTVGSGPSQWNEPREGTPTHVFPGGFRVVMYPKSMEGNVPAYHSQELSSGTNTITIPSNMRTSDLVVYYVGWANKDPLNGGATGDHIVHSATFQRKNPINLVVPLDDPEANSFIRGGLGGSEERRAQLKDILESGNEWLTMLGLEPSKTSPGDIELAQAEYPHDEWNAEDEALLKWLQQGGLPGADTEKDIERLLQRKSKYGGGFTS